MAAQAQVQSPAQQERLSLSPLPGSCCAGVGAWELVLYTNIPGSQIKVFVEEGAGGMQNPLLEAQSAKTKLCGRYCGRWERPLLHELETPLQLACQAGCSHRRG